MYVRGAMLQESQVMQMDQTQPYCIAIPNENDTFALEETTDVLRLQQHLCCLHEDLVEFS
jgi:hypothetical protein